MATTLTTTNYRTISWTLAASENGDYFKNPKLSDKTVQMFGTFGGTVTMQGSNDPRVESDAANAAWFSITDNTASAIALTAPGGRLMAEDPLYIRPSAGVGVTAVTIIVQATES